MINLVNRFNNFLRLLIVVTAFALTLVCVAVAVPFLAVILVCIAAMIVPAAVGFLCWAILDSLR